jgi:lipopolysaccharide transport system ATP-binding protein
MALRGDASFAAKAQKRLNDLVERSSILVLASHSPELIKRVCNRIIRLEHGKIAEDLRLDPASTEAA